MIKNQSDQNSMEKDPYGRFILARWDYLSGWVKLKIVLMVFMYTWQGDLARWWLGLTNPMRK